MRRLLLCIFGTLLIAGAASAQDKVDSQLKCGKPSSQQKIDVGDTADHAFSIARFSCTFQKGEIGGVKDKDGVGVQFDEVSANSSRYHGYFMETAANGDSIHYSYKGTASLKSGVLVSGSHKWTVIRGTGKFSDIKGGGKCKGTGNPDGTVMWSCTGTYVLKAAPAAATEPNKT